MTRIWLGALLLDLGQEDLRQVRLLFLGNSQERHISPGAAPSTLTCANNFSGGTENTWRTSRGSQLRLTVTNYLFP